MGRGRSIASSGAERRSLGDCDPSWVHAPHVCSPERLQDRRSAPEEAPEAPGEAPEEAPASPGAPFAPHPGPMSFFWNFSWSLWSFFWGGATVSEPLRGAAMGRVGLRKASKSYCQELSCLRTLRSKNKERSVQRTQRSENTSVQRTQPVRTRGRTRTRTNRRTFFPSSPRARGALPPGPRGRGRKVILFVLILVLLLVLIGCVL